MAGELTSAEYAYLTMLKAEGREVSNSELDTIYEVRLIKPEFEKLNADGYIESNTRSRPYRHTITDKGLKALSEPLTIDQARVPDGEKRPANERQLYWAAMVAMHRLLTRAPAEKESREKVAQPDLGSRIRAAYDELAGGPGDWVSLTALRPQLPGVPKADLDRALTDLLDDPEVRLEPEPFGHRIGAAERRAAVHIGGEDRHKMAIGRP